MTRTLKATVDASIYQYRQRCSALRWPRSALTWADLLHPWAGYATLADGHTERKTPRKSWPGAGVDDPGTVPSHDALSFNVGINPGINIDLHLVLRCRLQFINNFPYSAAISALRVRNVLQRPIMTRILHGALQHWEDTYGAISLSRRSVSTRYIGIEREAALSKHADT